MIKTMAELLAPQISELDAMAVDVYGLKSKAADDMAKDERWSIESFLANTGGENIFGQEVPALSEEDFMGLLMGISGGVKIPGKLLNKMFESVPKATKKMPKTQYQYERPEFKPNPTGTFRDQKTGRLVNVETAPQKLYRELTEGGLDSYEFQKKLFELEQMAPELSDKIIKEFL